MKIRGTAHHIGEKYLQLARDAHSSGDPVRAESYLQHAEHYFRVIATAQQAQQAHFGYGRQPGDQPDLDDDGDDDDFGSMPDRFASPVERNIQPTPPPMPERQPQASERGNGQPYAYGERGGSDRPSHERQDRGYDNRNGRGYDNRNGHDRGNQGHGGDRNGYDRGAPERREQDRGAQPERNGQQDRGAQPDRGGRDDRQPRDYDNRSRPPRPVRPNSEPRQTIGQPVSQPVTDEPVNGLPAFITAPTRVTSESVAPEPASVEQPPALSEAGNDAGHHLRPRRRRRTKADFAGETERAETPSAPDPVGE